MPKQQPTYASKADENPWRVDDRKTTEEWFQFALWYPYSVRSLVSDGGWYELARCSNHDSAYHAMKGVAAIHHAASNCYVVVHCIRLGKEGREKAVLFSPNERIVQAEPAKTKESKR